MKNGVGLHIFRRDLRLEDNTALIRALKENKEVIPCFIFDKRQLENNDYRGDNCVQFMIDSIQDLKKQIENKGGKLYLFYGKADEVVDLLLKEIKISKVYVNRDYTPFSLKRDAEIKKVCDKREVDFVECDDLCLNAPGTILKDDQLPYTVFTAFMKKSKKIKVKEVELNNYSNYFKGKIDFEFKDVQKILNNRNSNVVGGREQGLKILNEMKKFDRYEEERNFPALNKTTKLSAHNKFGTVSIREVYNSIKKNFGSECTLISELYWRDFFTHIGAHFPNVFGNAFHEKYNKIKWENDEKKFRAWKEGKTGFPIVDAGMRELNQTGFMHNRVRMIVASFLVKDLHIDWRWGEKYFANKLVDYDPAVNNGNWQWAASTGCDSQPYFRIFNPWLQQKKFDSECEYIKKWIPELKDVKSEDIHNFFDEVLVQTDYPRPIVDHSIESKKAIKAYKEC